MVDGVLVFINALYFAYTGDAYGVTVDSASPYAIAGIALAGAIFGLVIIIAGIEMRKKDLQDRLSWSVVVAVISALSLTMAGGGFVAGFFIGLIAAAIGIRSAGPPVPLDETDRINPRHDQAIISNPFSIYPILEPPLSCRILHR